MKKYILISFLGLFFLTSCEKTPEKAEESEATEQTKGDAEKTKGESEQPETPATPEVTTPVTTESEYEAEQPVTPDTPEQSLLFSYPKTGKYGLNILAEDFLEAKVTELGRYEYSVRAELPEGNSSLKIVIKSVNPIIYVCVNEIQVCINEIPSHELCGAKFYELHDKCPVCGGENTFHNASNPWGGWTQGSDVNWLISNANMQLTFTYVDELVHKDGKVADASVIFKNDCIVEYYESGAETPTKVKVIKVID